jgi:acetyltransferase-like isoleucine patch superfamily enzyme
MRNTLNKIVSMIKKEEFHIHESISINYLLLFFIKKIISYLRFTVKMRSIRLGFVGKRTVILSLDNITFGRNLSISDDCYIDALSKEGIILGDNISIQKKVIIECTGSLKKIGKGLKIGDHVGIGSNSFLGCAGGIEIGNNTIIGNYVSFHSENHNFARDDIPIRLQGVNRQGIKIGENCWIGAKATLLDGCILNAGCIVAAGAVLNAKEYKKNSIVGGVPAKLIKKRVLT